MVPGSYFVSHRCLLGATVISSPLLAPYREWTDAGRIQMDYIQGVSPCLSTLPSKARLAFDNVPMGVDYGTRQSKISRAVILAERSIKSFLDITQSTKNFQVISESSIIIKAPPEDMNIMCYQAKDAWHIAATEVPEPEGIGQ